MNRRDYSMNSILRFKKQSVLLNLIQLLLIIYWPIHFLIQISNKQIFKNAKSVKTKKWHLMRNLFDILKKFFAKLIGHILTIYPIQIKHIVIFCVPLAVCAIMLSSKGNDNKTKIIFESLDKWRSLKVKRNKRWMLNI